MHGVVPSMVIPISGIETMQEGVKGADVEPTQITSGALTGSLTFADLSGGMLSVGRLHGDVRIRGPLSDEHLTLGMLIKATGRTMLWSAEAQAGTASAIPAKQSHESVFMGDCVYAALAIPYDRILALVDSRELRIAHDFWDTMGIYGAPQSDINALTTLTTAVSDLATRRSPVLATLSAREAMLDDLLDGFLEYLTHTTHQPHQLQVCGNHVHTMIHDAEDYLRTHLDRPVRMAELCIALGTSERSLHRLFKSIVGLPPAVYLRMWRLSQVRRALLGLSPRLHSVTDVALHFGFWELGRFAQQYRALFGERPSQTLQRAGEAEIPGLRTPVFA
ncbi:MAG: helix-turn-helix transcriptional regulator [Rhodospirillaceae bacterium]|jgi:AraC-like DNA-binding protein|nr:helix-turn-helix transcriptional regulator [Rhodospirillaceae bacterium]MBT6205037.1 helix-turn-helix transcriptional regulator [Rhodospirillaceae bacterium]MBT6512505.1 helix-turn-helix transcriptional regulator [Rhodospirillaceae bacterium]MBT7611897.1 helix-turn-helix transcriptional regulator [Rhodospirillaceae bacterium]